MFLYHTFTREDTICRRNVFVCEGINNDLAGDTVDVF